MAVDAKKIRRFESNALFINAFMGGFLAIFGLIAGIIAHSSTVSFDGFIALIDTIISCVAIYVSFKVDAPPNRDFHFGFLKMEPATVNLQAIMLFTSSMIAIIFSLKELVHKHEVASLGLSLTYSGFNIAVTIGMTLFLLICYHRYRSELVRVNLIEWSMDTVMAFGILAGFIICHFMREFPLTAPYAFLIDPLMTIILALILIYEPVKLYLDSLYDLLDASPGQDVENKLLGIVKTYAEQHSSINEKKVQLKLRRAGRKIIATVYYDISPDLPMREIAKINRELHEKLNEALPRVLVDLVPFSAGRNK